MLTPLIVILSLTGCRKPPEAPEGLDGATSFLVKNFYADDLTFEAGIQGFMEWYAEDGVDLIDEQATLDTIGAFSVGDLTENDVAHLPIDDDILVDPNNDTYEARDLSRCKGVVSLAMMECDWKRAEGYLARPDQDVVFSEDFEGYERDYLSDRATFEDAVDEFDKIKDSLDPFADDFDREAYARTLLMTENEVDPTKVITANMDPYPMNLDLRHGTFDIDGEETGVLAILTYNIGAAWGSAGNNALLQSFSVEINVEQGDDTLRMLAVWVEPKGGGIDPDSALALNFAVNKAEKSSERLSGICAGDIDVPGE